MSPKGASVFYLHILRFRIKQNEGIAVRNREKLVRRTCLGLILCLTIYSGCLLFSRCTGIRIPWIQWLQQQVVQGCLTVCQPVLGTDIWMGDHAESPSWQDGALQLVGAALDWPVVLESLDNHEGKTDIGDTLQGAGNDATRGASEAGENSEWWENREKSEIDNQTLEENGESEENRAENVYKSGEIEQNQTESKKQSGGKEQNSKEGVSERETATATVSTPQIHPALLPAGSEIRPEIAQLPAIAGLDMSQLLNFHYLIPKLYVVNGGCSVTEEVLNPGLLLSKNLTITHETEGYEILIYHTHSQEAFADSVPGDVSHTVVGLGAYLTTLLQEKGYKVLHHTGIFDMENGVLERDYAYHRALPVLEQILAENPSIQVVIDLHRDGVAEDVHLIADVNGEQTARLMFFNGMCRDEAGERMDVTNPYREDNLAFSLQSALQLEAHYPGMLRVVYLKQSRYNQHLRSRSMLVEVGAQTNTVDEVYRTIPVLADVLGKVLQ